MLRLRSAEQRRSVTTSSDSADSHSTFSARFTLSRLAFSATRSRRVGFSEYLSWLWSTHAREKAKAGLTCVHGTQKKPRNCCQLRARTLYGLENRGQGGFPQVTAPHRQFAQHSAALHHRAQQLEPGVAEAVVVQLQVHDPVKFGVFYKTKLTHLAPCRQATSNSVSPPHRELQRNSLALRHVTLDRISTCGVT